MGLTAAETVPGKAAPDSCKVAPADAAEVTLKKKTPVSVPTNLLVAGCVLLLAVAVMEQVQEMTPDKLQAWAKSLNEPHVVPPPNAGKNEVTIQFCQS